MGNLTRFLTVKKTGGVALPEHIEKLNAVPLPPAKTMTNLTHNSLFNTLTSIYSNAVYYILFKRTQDLSSRNKIG